MCFFVKFPICVFVEMNSKKIVVSKSYSLPIYLLRKDVFSNSFTPIQFTEIKKIKILKNKVPQKNKKK